MNIRFNFQQIKTKVMDDQKVYFLREIQQKSEAFWAFGLL